MSENMKKFLELLSRDKDAAQKLSDASKEQLISAAKDLGIELTEADFTPTNKLSDDELEAVAGGDSCWCVAGGGGLKHDDGSNDPCGCFAYGCGFIDDLYRCECIGFGTGTDEYIPITT